MTNRELRAAPSPWVLGIDPGSKGALVAVRADRSEHRVFAMPVLARSLDVPAVADILRGLAANGDRIDYCVIERAQPMPGQGVVSMFTTGYRYGALIACLELCGVPFEEVGAAAWKRALLGVQRKRLSESVEPLPPATALFKKQEARKATKALAIVTARRLYPSVPFRDAQDGIAEALLMAEAARRMLLSGRMDLVSPPETNDPSDSTSPPHEDTP